MDSALKEKQKQKQRQIYLSINTVQKYSLLANTPVTAMYYDPQKKRNKVTKCVQVWDFRNTAPDCKVGNRRPAHKYCMQTKQG